MAQLRGGQRELHRRLGRLTVCVEHEVARRDLDLQVSAEMAAAEVSRQGELLAEVKESIASVEKQIAHLASSETMLAELVTEVGEGRNATALEMQVVQLQTRFAEKTQQRTRARTLAPSPPSSSPSNGALDADAIERDEALFFRQVLGRLEEQHLSVHTWGATHPLK